jgi:hypothetical protein
MLKPTQYLRNLLKASPQAQTFFFDGNQKPGDCCEHPDTGSYGNSLQLLQ